MAVTRRSRRHRLRVRARRIAPSRALRPRPRVAGRIVPRPTTLPAAGPTDLWSMIDVSCSGSIAARGGVSGRADSRSRGDDPRVDPVEPWVRYELRARLLREPSATGELHALPPNRSTRSAIQSGRHRTVISSFIVGTPCVWSARIARCRRAVWVRALENTALGLDRM